MKASIAVTILGPIAILTASSVLFAFGCEPAVLLAHSFWRFTVANIAIYGMTIGAVLTACLEVLLAVSLMATTVFAIHG